MTSRVLAGRAIQRPSSSRKPLGGVSVCAYSIFFDFEANASWVLSGQFAYRGPARDWQSAGAPRCFAYPGVRQMVSNTTAAIRSRPGSRAFSIVGASHKAYFEAYLDQRQNVELAPKDMHLAPGVHEMIKGT